MTTKSRLHGGDRPTVTKTADAPPEVIVDGIVKPKAGKPKVAKPKAAKPKAQGATGPSFDRIKPPPSATPPKGPVVDAREDDVQGKRALFSGAAQPPSWGSVALECPECSRRSVVSFVRLAKMFTAGIYLPIPGSTQRAWLKCPACKKHATLTITRS